MRKYNYILGIVGMFFLSCEQDNPAAFEQPEAQQINAPVEKKNRILDMNVGVYKDYFVKTENTIGFNSLKANAWSNHSVKSNILTNHMEGTSLLIDGQKSPLKSLADKSKAAHPEIFGKTISLRYRNTKTNSDVTSDEIYIPKKLNVSKPLPTSKDKINVVAYYENFLLEWNADPKNEEGLMVAVIYNGENLYANKNENVQFRNIDHIEHDNGKYVLKNAMFEDIPNLSFIEIVLLRGNIAIDEIDGETFKTYAESHQRIQVLLIKDMNSIKSFDSKG